MKCVLCGGNTEPVITSIDTQWGDYQVTIKGLSALRCNKCHEEYFDDSEVDVIQSLSAGFADHSSSDKPDILNIQEVADLLRVSKQTIYNMIKDGRITAFKVGREWRFNRDDLTAIMNPDIAVAARGSKISQNDQQIIMNIIRKGSNK